MLAKHLTVPHRFVCVTDDVEGMERAGVEAFPIWNLPVQVEASRRFKLNNYIRLGMFDEDIGGRIGDELLSIDLDIVVRANLDSLIPRDVAFKIMCLKSRTWLQGGLFYVRPGLVSPNPWAMLRDHPDIVERARAAGYCGSDQAVLSFLFYELAVQGELPYWDEDDGISVNELDQPEWRLFFRTGDLKCWHEDAPERALYFAESGADPATVPPEPKISKSATTPGGLFSRAASYQKLRHPDPV